MNGLRDCIAEWGACFRRRSPLARVAFGGLAGFLVSAPFSISLAQICVFTAMAAWLVWQGGNSPLVTQKFPLWRPWLLFTLLTLASAFHSPDAAKGLLKTRESTQIMIFYLAANVVEDDREALLLVKALLLATSVAALYALGVSLQTSLSLASRAAGFFSTYMTLGGFLLVAAALALAYVFVPAAGRKSRWVYAAAALLVAALAATLSRNAWVGLVVAVLVIAVAGRSKKAVLCLALAAALAAFTAPDSIGKRVASLTNLRDATLVERLHMWRTGLVMTRESPFLGVGPDQVKDAYPRYMDSGMTQKVRGHLHNNIVHLAAERGLPALAAWIWAWVGYFVLVVRRMRDARAAPFGTRFRMVGGLAAASGFLCAGMFEYNFGDSEVVMLAFVASALPFMGAESRPEQL